jgi:hypothetical protein
LNDRTHPALLTLAENACDAGAKSALYEENRVTIEAAIEQWLRNPQDTAAIETVLARIARRARFYNSEEDAAAWVADCADLECRRLKNETERIARHHN